MENLNLGLLRDKKGGFEPKIVPKNTRDVSGIEDKVISLYARGSTTREIQSMSRILCKWKLSKIEETR